jgi:hypothetical protein
MDRRFAPWGWHTQWYGDGTRSDFEAFRLWAAQHANGDDPWRDAYAIALAMAELYRREIEQLKESRDRLEQWILEGPMP